MGRCSTTLRRLQEAKQLPVRLSACGALACALFASTLVYRALPVNWRWNDETGNSTQLVHVVDPSHEEAV
jgi:hypothetical protein